MRHALALGIGLATCALAAGARGANGDELLDAPAPPTLPALAHKDLRFTFEYTAASIEPNAPAGAGGRSYAWFAHTDLELPIVPRKWYMGLAYDTAAATVPGIGRDFFPGNPELTARGLWSSTQGFSAGGGLGIVLPVPRELAPDQATILRAARSIRPWDAAYFTDLTLTFRPSFDIRHVTGRFILQLRQGIDWSIALPRAKASGPGSDLTARATFYIGYRAAEPVGIGLELWEVYQLTADVPDDKRAAFAVSPSIRFILPRVQPALSVLVPLSTPLRGDVASYYGARFNVSFDFERRRAEPVGK
ncbi:hypothetical protein [Polyangium aurulentum]|uniref:hypothetical protein n=1 Tax=Polyangium aurulentum TaxID=2567896 RepID=UPI0010AECC19|nr:hypothetical protein [Polyangium aurulentum]UQA60984.1 hypothetical protein E8A73_011105 [Polyangium aurulentum]